MLKLNVDGSFSTTSNMMYTGGLIRDSNGDWKSGFSTIEGPGNALLAEILTVKNGLTHAWVNGARVVLCETDSAEVHSLLTGDNDLSYHAHSGVIGDIRTLIRRDWTISFEHVLREANMAADYLAKNAASLSSWWPCCSDPPLLMGALLLKDSLGCSS